MRQQHVAENPACTEFAPQTQSVGTSLYTRVRASQSHGQGFVVLGPFATPLAREQRKGELCKTIPALIAELGIDRRNKPFDVTFENFESFSKPERLIGSSVDNCLAHLKAGYWSRQS